MDVPIKREVVQPRELAEKSLTKLIDISDSDSIDTDSDLDNMDDLDIEGILRRKRQKLGVALPVGFLDPLSPEERASLRLQTTNSSPPLGTLSSPETFGKNTPSVLPKESLSAPEEGGTMQLCPMIKSCKQFWRAGDYEGSNGGETNSYSGGIDRVRVPPRFLHSNATSHKWALGAFAELLDNALDEVCNGATYVCIDMLNNKKDKSEMLLIEDNGGGMSPDKMRQCMSLGYSVKSKMANTIGQYGNGFKTSTMRLGADVIVFSRCHGDSLRSPTQSIGMLSYTFLRGTGKEDIIVPMIDFEKKGQDWSMMMRSSPEDWNRNLETIVQWSPYLSESDVLQRFDSLEDQGTRIVIYNLWEDDQGNLELDFDIDQHDIQIRGVNRDEKKIDMAKTYPNSRHFLTYQHSLRSYASILYLRLPSGFRIILRGKDVDHHNLVNDMMLAQEVTYKPQAFADGTSKNQNVHAIVTIGFVKDAKHHIDVQGFNVYHKNRLIKPFWRVWNAAGSDGRGVVGVLEANFVEPAHDKQGFERTTVLSRLEARLVWMQKNYWSTNCHQVGYAKRRNSKDSVSPDVETNPSPSKKSFSSSNSDRHVFSNGGSKGKPAKKNEKRPHVEHTSEDGIKSAHNERPAESNHSNASLSCGEAQQECGKAQQECAAPNSRTNHTSTPPRFKDADITGTGDRQPSDELNSETLAKLKEENGELRKRLEKAGDSMVIDLLHGLRNERDRSRSLEMKLQEAQRMIEEMDREQEALIDVFSEERNRRDLQEESLRKKLKDASNTIQELVDKVTLLERARVSPCKTESNNVVSSCKVER